MTRRYRNPEETRWVSLAQIAGEIGRTPVQAAKLLKKTGFIGYKPKRGSSARTIVYDARALEVLKGLLDIPTRHISDHADDWLSNYLGGQPHV